MPIEVTARHMEADDRLQEYARNKAQIIVEEFPRVEHIHVIFDNEKHRFKTAVVVRGRNHVHVEAEEVSDNVISSTDRAFEKIEKQLRKMRDKIQDHKVVMKYSEKTKGKMENGDGL